MSKRADTDYLLDIREAIRRIVEYVGAMTYAEFLSDFKTQDAVTRNLEVIGEATKNISTELRLRHAVVPWKSMAQVRDRLIHHYFGVNPDIVWVIVKNELTELDRVLEKILSEKQETK